MTKLLSRIRLLMSYCLFVIFMILAYNYHTAVYLCYQAAGQMNILFGRQNLNEFEKNNNLSNKERQNILLIEQIKKYSVDSLGYMPTNNFTKIYDQKKSPILWVLTASYPYQLKAYEWNFPLIGRVSYKGFFKKELALKEYNHLKVMGYDVDLVNVSAWSTLGWFDDPLLSSMLNRSKGSLCNLLFHELFHATFYAPNEVNFNENIANFIAHKATIQFLKNDTLSLNEYLNNYSDNLLFSNFMQKQNTYLSKYYSKIQKDPNRYILKLKAIGKIADSVSMLNLKNPEKATFRKKQILEQKNALFIDYVQYESMQDSLELTFNKIYKGELKKLVQDLKQKQTIIKFDKNHSL